MNPKNYRINCHRCAQFVSLHKIWLICVNKIMDCLYYYTIFLNIVRFPDPYNLCPREIESKCCCILWVHIWSNTITCHGVVFSIAQWFCTCSLVPTMSHLCSIYTSSTYIKENWALDRFESRMALELIGVGSINHAHAHSTYNLGPIKIK